MNFGTNIVFVGDPHGQLVRAVETILRMTERPKAIVLLGDHDLGAPLDLEVLPLAQAGIETWWIPGNHDSDLSQWHQNLFASNLADRNLDARVVEIAGVRVAGLGGVFRGKWWMPDPAAPRYQHAPRWKSRHEWLEQIKYERKKRRNSATYGDQLVREAYTSIWFEDYERLRNQRADVLVCHEAPSCHPHGFRALDDLAAAMRVWLVVHGHHHTDYDATINDGRIRVMGVGLAGVRAMDGSVIREGQRSTGRPVLACAAWKSKVEKTK